MSADQVLQIGHKYAMQPLLIYASSALSSYAQDHGWDLEGLFRSIELSHAVLTPDDTEEGVWAGPSILPEVERMVPGLSAPQAALRSQAIALHGHILWLICGLAITG